MRANHETHSPSEMLDAQSGDTAGYDWLEQIKLNMARITFVFLRRLQHFSRSARQNWTPNSLQSTITEPLITFSTPSTSPPWSRNSAPSSMTRAKTRRCDWNLSKSHWTVRVRAPARFTSLARGIHKKLQTLAYFIQAIVGIVILIVRRPKRSLHTTTYCTESYRNNKLPTK